MSEVTVNNHQEFIDILFYEDSGDIYYVGSEWSDSSSEDDIESKYQDDEDIWGNFYYDRDQDSFSNEDQEPNEREQWIEFLSKLDTDDIECAHLAKQVSLKINEYNYTDMKEPLELSVCLPVNDIFMFFTYTREGLQTRLFTRNLTIHERYEIITFNLSLISTLQIYCNLNAFPQGMLLGRGKDQTMIGEEFIVRDTVIGYHNTYLFINDD